jgi:long-subunit acyl-CoA synthetase (AMP-forming)
MTETSPTTHLLSQFDSRRKMGSIGLLLPNLEARLIEDDDGDVDAGDGKPGELWIRGPTVMKVNLYVGIQEVRADVDFFLQGYLNNPTATKNAVTPDGWYRTGDVAIRDKEGHFFIVDRRKELIKYKVFRSRNGCPRGTNPLGTLQGFQGLVEISYAC